MNFRLKSRHLISLVKYVISFNLIFLAGSFIFHFYFYKIQNGNWENGSGIKYLLVEFSLANENVLATWYSSMLLLFVGIIFFINYFVQKREFAKRKNNLKAYGWIIISGIFVLLSLDEMASLHERLGSINGLGLLGENAPGWVKLLAIPIALVAGFMIWFCLLQLKRAPLAAVCAVVGVLFFASIPVQEYYEIKAWQEVGFTETWQRPIGFLLLEEGCELFGTTLMMVSGILFIYYGSNEGNKPTAQSFLELKLHINYKRIVLQWALVILVLALLMLTIVRSDLLLLDGDHGKRENWFPAATAFFSSLLCLYLYLRHKSYSINSRNTLLYSCLFCLVISAYYGTNIYSYMYGIKESLLKILLVAILSLTTIALSIKLITNIANIYIKATVVLWACLLIPAFGISGWFSAALVYAGFSFLFVSLLHILTSKVSASSTSPVTNKQIV